MHSIDLHLKLAAQKGYVNGHFNDHAFSFFALGIGKWILDR